MNCKAPLTETVVTAVATSEGVDAMDIQPLSEAIEGESLERLFRDTTGHVTFEYHGYEVTVTSERDVSLEPLGE